MELFEINNEDVHHLITDMGWRTPGHSTKKSEDDSHDVKKNILKKVGRERFRKDVGENPDIRVRHNTDDKFDEIVLQGVGPHKGKVFPSGLRAEDYLVKGFMIGNLVPGAVYDLDEIRQLHQTSPALRYFAIWDIALVREFSDKHGEFILTNWHLFDRTHHREAENNQNIGFMCSENGHRYFFLFTAINDGQYVFKGCFICVNIVNAHSVDRDISATLFKLQRIETRHSIVNAPLQT